MFFDDPESRHFDPEHYQATARLKLQGRLPMKTWSMDMLKSELMEAAKGRGIDTFGMNKQQIIDELLMADAVEASDEEFTIGSIVGGDSVNVYDDTLVGVPTAPPVEEVKTAVDGGSALDKLRAMDQPVPFDKVVEMLGMAEAKKLSKQVTTLKRANKFWLEIK